MFENIKEVKNHLRGSLPHSYQRSQVIRETYQYLKVVMLYTNGNVRKYLRRYYRLLKRKSEFYKMNVRFTCNCSEV